MLSPHDRASLFEALRPPPGYLLDAAVGTSFTLDLEALLTAPIAFALFDAEGMSGETGEDQGLEPVGLLEAIRRHAGRITMFCQAGQIAVPRRHRTVFAWLEEGVAEVESPRPHRLFHPKVWLTRYEHASGERRILRVLCATRNLTFDSSWDTLLTLETEPYAETPTGSTSGRELAELFRQLPGMATRTLGESRQALIDDLAQDLQGATFACPEPFDQIAFHVLGLDGRQELPFPSASARALVVSPFLSEPFLERVLDSHDVALLLSREESLDRIDSAVLRQAQRLAVLNPAADLDPVTDVDVDTSSHESGDPGQSFGGLHAKLFVFDTSDGAVVFTGSANATEAAFGGNVEVLVELRGPHEAGVAALMSETPGEVGFDDLLIDYEPLAEPIAETDEDRLSLGLDEVRRTLAGMSFAGVVQSQGESYSIELSSDGIVPGLDADSFEVTVWPVTLSEDQSAAAVPVGTAVAARFEVSLEGISSLFVFRLRASRGAVTDTTSFLVNAALDGVPEDRHNRLLASMLRDGDRLLRYLLLLLADDSAEAEQSVTGSAASWLDRWGGAGWDEIPLLELMVRALDRHPDRLDHIERLLTDLGDEREKVLPADFDAIWRPISEARAAAD